VIQAAGGVSSSQKEEIRSRVPLEELLREYNIQLIPSGRKLKGLCPFHQEKTPSFHVDVEKQLYYCFGCQEGGDVFRFVQAMDRVSFPDAIEMLARRAGVVLERGRFSGERRGSKTIELYDSLSLAARWYHHLLLEDPRGQAARQYLKQRGIREEMWRRFQLGYSLPDWDGLLRLGAKEGVRPELLESVGLARRRERAGGHYDYFRGRLMFPIADPQNRVIGFGARTLGDEMPKYLNTPKTALFDKSQVLYGLPQARSSIHKHGRIGIVEGYTDVIVSHQAGLEFFVASLGTAFTAENARQLSRHLGPTSRRVLLVLDGDAAGQQASERSLGLLLAEELDVQIYSVRDGKDPCDAIQLLGGEEFLRRLDVEAVGIFEFKWRRTVGSEEARGGVASRARALDEFLRLLALVPNVVARKLIQREFVERLGISEDDIEERLRKVSPPAGGSSAEPPRRRNEPSSPPQGALPIEPLAELVLECLLSLPEMASSMWRQVPGSLFASPAGREIARAIDGQLQNGPFSGVRLAREVEEPEAHRVLVKVLSRLEGDRAPGSPGQLTASSSSGSARSGGLPAVDYELLWANCLRDLRRWEARTRLDELEKLLALARAQGRAEDYERHRLERSRLLRELKKRNT
jgi:DNA primase